MKLFSRLMAVLLLFAFTAGSVMAQDIRGVPVTERPRPDYDALGIRAGAFLVKPEMKLGLEYNDNIYATKDDKTSDVIAIVAPAANVASDWSRHSLSVSVGLKGGIYIDKSDENYLDAHLLLNGRVDVLRNSYLNLNLGTSRLHEERGAPDAVRGDKEPVVYYRSQAEASYHHAVGRVGLSGGAGLTNYSFDTVEQMDGSTRRPGDARDRNHFNVNARVSYELLPNVRPFVAGRFEWRRYDADLNMRDSDGARIGAGTGFDLGGVITGEVFAGYMNQEFKHGRYSNISAPWYGAALLWNPTQLTSVQARAEKSVKETTLAGASAIDALDASLRVDHELLRNLLVGGFFDYTRDDYEGPSITDNYYTLGPRMTYLWNRNLDAGFQYAYKTKTSDLDFREYTENRFTLSVTGKF